MKKLMAAGMFSVLGTAAILSLDIGLDQSQSDGITSTIGASASDGVIDTVAQSEEDKKKKKEKGSGSTGSDKRGS